MSELREYPEGRSFNGVVGRTVAESQPAWPRLQHTAASHFDGAGHIPLIHAVKTGIARVGAGAAGLRRVVRRVLVDRECVCRNGRDEELAVVQLSHLRQTLQQDVVADL